eukprot:SAG31_NODE_3211_length_4548_cov_3.394695_1_plen_79_part_00
MAHRPMPANTAEYRIQSSVWKAVPVPEHSTRAAPAAEFGIRISDPKIQLTGEVLNLYPGAGPRPCTRLYLVGVATVLC